jgi:hypothetical protein
VFTNSNADTNLSSSINSNPDNPNSNLSNTDFTTHNEHSSIRFSQHILSQTNKCPHNERTLFASHNEHTHFASHNERTNEHTNERTDFASHNERTIFASHNGTVSTSNGIPTVQGFMSAGCHR